MSETELNEQTRLSRERARLLRESEDVVARVDRAYRAGYRDGQLARARPRSTRSQVLLPMHPGYVAWWISLFALILVADFFVAPWWVWASLIVVFLTVEGVALRRRKHGDTFSELMWTIRYGGSDRRWIAYGVAVYLPVRFAIVGLTLPEWATAVPRMILAFGVMGWLLSHFNKFGKDG